MGERWRHQDVWVLSRSGQRSRVWAALGALVTLGAAALAYFALWLVVMVVW